MRVVRVMGGVVLIRVWVGASAVAMDRRGPGSKCLMVAGRMPETEYPDRARGASREVFLVEAGRLLWLWAEWGS